MLFGKFLARLFQDQKKSITDIKKECERSIENNPSFVISFLCELNKHLNVELINFSKICIERIQEKKINTKTLMLIFDLQGIIDS